MGEYADLELNRLFDSYMDGDDDDEVFYQAKPTKCKRCGSTKVHWRNLSNESAPQWRLFNDGVLDKEHTCNVMQEDEFEDLT